MRENRIFVSTLMRWDSRSLAAGDISRTTKIFPQNPFFLNTYSPFTSGLVLAFIKIQIFIKNPIFLSPTHCKGWKSNRLKVKDS
jgi:hypothetical protein